MEKTESTQEKSMRLGLKQTSKGYWYAELTVRADTMEELDAKLAQLRDYALKQIKILNGGN